MRRETVMTLIELAAIVAVCAAVLALLTLCSGGEKHDGAGPVLVDALESGWRPDLSPKHAGACGTMCGGDKCCDRCATVDRCCCRHQDWKCDCKKNPTRGDR